MDSPDNRDNALKALPESELINELKILAELARIEWNSIDSLSDKLSPLRSDQPNKVESTDAVPNDWRPIHDTTVGNLIREIAETIKGGTSYLDKIQRETRI